MSTRQTTILRLLQRHSTEILPTIDTGRGEQAPARCPFHKEGQEGKPSFYWNLASGLFCCLACGVSGGLYDFMMLAGYTKEEVKKTIQEIRNEDGELPAIPKSSFRRAGEADLLRINPILPDWYLGTFDYTPVSLTEAGFDDRMLREFGIGYDIARHRVTFPIRDIHGNLIGISGREDGKLIGSHTPKYKFYRTELRDLIPGYELDKSVTLWNGHRLWAKYVTSYLPECTPPVIFLVEGYKAALHLIRLGYQDTVALMGTSMSQVQRYLLSTIGGDILILLDNNEPGRKGAEKIYKDLRHNSAAYPYLLRYPDGSAPDCQPDDLNGGAIETMIKEGYQ